MNTKGGQLIGELSKVQILLEGHKILKNYLVIGEIFFKILRPLRKTELYLFMSFFSHLHDLLSTIKIVIYLATSLELVWLRNFDHIRIFFRVCILTLFPSKYVFFRVKDDWVQYFEIPKCLEKNNFDFSVFNRNISKFM